MIYIWCKNLLGKGQTKCNTGNDNYTCDT